MMRAAVLAAAAALAPAATGAAELREITVDYDGKTYTVNSRVWFDAPQQAVYDVFADWDLSEQFSSVIVEARDLGRDENGVRRFYVRNRACVLFFCKTTERTGSVTEEPPTEIVATANPAESDFALCEERWSFAPDDEGTLMHYTMHMQPSFWVPPVVGPWAIKRELREKAGEVIERIEALAQSGAGADGPGSTPDGDGGNSRAGDPETMKNHE
ncbi:MAG TPA: SRPBCC family protein [Woeseiaceae bacterium]|nr:SRPBCC family protein [Woeseiaceae bacterium]